MLLGDKTRGINGSCKATSNFRNISDLPWAEERSVSVAEGFFKPAGDFAKEFKPQSDRPSFSCSQYTTRASACNSPSVDLINSRSFCFLACRTSTRVPREQTFSVVDRSPADGSFALEIRTGMASRVLFSSRPDRIGIWCLTFQTAFGFVAPGWAELKYRIRLHKV